MGHSGQGPNNISKVEEVDEIMQNDFEQEANYYFGEIQIQEDAKNHKIS